MSTRGNLNDLMIVNNGKLRRSKKKAPFRFTQKELVLFPLRKFQLMKLLCELRIDLAGRPTVGVKSIMYSTGDSLLSRIRQ